MWKLHYVNLRYLGSRCIEFFQVPSFLKCKLELFKIPVYLKSTIAFLRGSLILEDYNVPFNLFLATIPVLLLEKTSI